MAFSCCKWQNMIYDYPTTAAIASAANHFLVIVHT